MKIITIPKCNKIIKRLKLPNGFIIREAVDEDIIAWENMICQYIPLMIPNPEETLYWEKRRERKKLEITYTIVDNNNQIIAYGYAYEPTCFDLPDKCYIDLVVDKSHTGKGIGRFLYAKLLEWVKSNKQFTTLLARTKENIKQTLKFLEADGGWKAIWYAFNQRLDLSKWDPNSYIINPEEILHKQGLEIVTLYEICDENKDAVLREFYELAKNVSTAIPNPFGIEETWDYKVFRKELDYPGFDPKWIIFAREKNTKKLVAITYIQFKANGEVWTGLTGTLSEYRKRRIASALKVIMTRRAKDVGVKILSTHNDNGNVAMLRINERLGYVKGPASITFEKKLQK